MSTKTARRRALARMPSPANPLRADPTRTATLRRAFEAKVGQAFRLLQGRLVRLVADDDAFGLAAGAFMANAEEGGGTCGVGQTAKQTGCTPESGTPAKGPGLVKRIVARIPARVKGPVVKAAKAAYAVQVVANKAVQAVAREKGLPPERVERLAKAVAVVDVALSGSRSSAAAIAVGAGALAVPAAFVPWGSLGYLAHATATAPLAVARAARKGIAKLLRKLFGKGYRPPQPGGATLATAALAANVADDEAAVRKLADALAAGGWSDWHLALLLTAADFAGDLDEAVAWAAQALEEQPEPDLEGEDGAEEELFGHLEDGEEPDANAGGNNNPKGCNQWTGPGCSGGPPDDGMGAVRADPPLLRVDKAAVEEHVRDFGLESLRRSLEDEDPRDYFMRGWGAAYDRVHRAARRLADPEGMVGGESAEDLTSRVLDEVVPRSRAAADVMAHAEAYARKRGLAGNVANARKKVGGANCGTGAGGFKEGNTCAVGGGGRAGFSVEQVATGKARLEKMRSMETSDEEEMTFDSEISQVHMKEAGFKGRGHGTLDLPKDPGAFTTQEIDPKDLHYGQESVTRKGVEKKLEGHAGDDEFKAVGRPKVVKVPEGIPGMRPGYHIQEGHHRAFADAIAKGKVEVDVTEMVYNPKTKEKTHKKPTANQSEEPAANAAREFAFRSTPEKVAGFLEWLRGQVAEGLQGRDEEALWRAYVEAGLRKGAGKSFRDVKAGRKAKGDPLGRTAQSFTAETEEGFLRSSFAQPVAVETAQLLASRAFEDLKGVTADMALKMSRVLTDGLVQGKNPRTIAAELAREVGLARTRAETIARTEIVRAHAEGQLLALERLGVAEVGVEVEWLTAGDEKVCPLCSALSGATFPLAQARGMLPRHPRCRCAWMPAGEGVGLPKGQAKPGAAQAKAAARQAAKASRAARRRKAPAPAATVTGEIGGGGLDIELNHSPALLALSRLVTSAEPAGGNCGTGAGGFKPGNTCARGGEGGPPEVLRIRSIPVEKRPYKLDGGDRHRLMNAANVDPADVQDLDPARLVATQETVKADRLAAITGPMRRDKAILVVRHGGKDYIEEGHHRAIAAKMSGQKVPAVVVEVGPDGRAAVVKPGAPA